MAQKYPFSHPYYLSFENKPEYLLAKVTGETDTLEISIRFWTEIAREAEQRKAQKLLVWEDFHNMISTQDLLQFINELSKFQHLNYVKIAFVDEHLDQLDRNKLGEMMATNRGFCCRVFGSIPDAERWLIKA